MKQGKHAKPKPKFDIHTADWDSIFLFIVAGILGIALVVCLATGAFHAKHEAKSSETYPPDTNEDEWVPNSIYEAPLYIDEIPERIHIGRCRLTIYNATETHHGYNTATGVKSQHLMTCAVDPGLIPYGSNVILIKADGTEHRLKAVDCGNFRGRMIDVFFDGSVAGGVGWLVEVFGEEYADVWIETPGAQNKAL